MVYINIASKSGTAQKSQKRVAIVCCKFKLTVSAIAQFMLIMQLHEESYASTYTQTRTKSRLASMLEYSVMSAIIQFFLVVLLAFSVYNRADARHVTWMCVRNHQYDHAF